MARREYNGGAIRAVLGADITSSATTITLNATPGATNWPTGATGKFYIAIDRGNATEEKVLVLSRSGLTLTLSSNADRGADGSTAQAHTAGVYVEHVGVATDLDEANAFVNNPAVVGTVTASAPGDATAAGSSATWARGDHKHGRESTPIAIPTFTATNNSPPAPASSTTPVAVTFDSELVDTHNGHSDSSTPSRYTIPTSWAGTWFFSAQVQWTANATGIRIIQIRKNGSNVLLESVNNAQVTVNHGMNISGLISGLIVGDYLEVLVAQNSGSTLQITTTVPPKFTAHWVHA